MRLIIVIFLMSTLSFCAKNKENVYEPSKLLDPYKLYIEGLEAFKNNDYFFANKKFTEAELNFAEPELAAKSLFQDPKETFRPLTDAEKQTRGLDPEKSYQIGDISNKITQIGGTGTTIDLGGKKEIEFAKSQISQVEADLTRTAGYVNKSQAINRIETGLNNFQTGAFGDTRTFIGNVAETFGVDIKDSKFVNPDGQLITSGAAEFKRILALNILFN